MNLISTTMLGALYVIGLVITLVGILVNASKSPPLRRRVQWGDPLIVLFWPLFFLHSTIQYRERQYRAKKQADALISLLSDILDCGCIPDDKGAGWVDGIVVPDKK